MKGLEQRLHSYEPLFGSWKLCGEIGSGSFGRVYRVESRDLFGTVSAAALKVIEILPDLTPADSPERVRALVRRAYESEVSTMRTLRGVGNVVYMDDYAAMEIYEDGRLIGCDLLIRMELLESLSDLLRRKDSALRGREEIRRLGLDLSRALVRCHSVNILHRDINPRNIFRSRFGDYKLGDFGIAKQLIGTVHADTAIGTKNYAAPEVVAGEEYDVRADIYSLGLVLYQLTNRGYLPFFHRDLAAKDWGRAVARRLSGEPLPVPAGADAQLAEVIGKACAFTPAERYATAQELYDALHTLGTPEKTVPQVRKQTASDFWKEQKNRPGILSAVGLSVAATPEMRYVAAQLSEEAKDKPAGGVLMPRMAAHLPAWSIRAAWYPFNRLIVRDYTSIGERAFRGRKDLVSLRCGKRVRSIGMEAFLHCTNLAEVNCANGLEQVLDGAFSGCRKLTLCHLPDSVQVLGARAFADCTLLGSLRIPEGVRVVGDQLCAGCMALGQVTLPSSLKGIGQAAFCDSGLRKILLPDSCTQLGTAAFSGCRKLISVQFSLRLTVIPPKCFSGCKSLRQIDLPFRLTEIREGAFSGCSALTQLVIPEGVRRIGRQAFARCDSLSVIRVPRSVQYIGEEAFGTGGRVRGKLGRLTVIAAKDSYAWQYCRQCGIRVRES